MILLEKIIFYLLVFALPFQIRKVLYQFGDNFNEWAGFYLYFTDLLIVFLLLFWFWRVNPKGTFRKRIKLSDIGKDSVWLFGFLIVAYISLVKAQNIYLAFYSLLKLLEFIGLFFYLKHNFGRIFQFRRIGQILVFGGFLQSIAAILQYAGQKSLGLGFLKESALSPQINGVAKIELYGQKLIRAYGTLPHPNILAAFLLVCLLFLIFLWLSKEHSLLSSAFLFLIFTIINFALWLTFSRTIIFSFLVASIAYLVIFALQALKAGNKELFKKTLSGFLVFVFLSSFFVLVLGPEIFNRFNILLKEQSVSLRSFYNQAALLAISENPFFGLGLGNFVLEIQNTLNLLAPWLHQPVHNIYLLIGSETGLIGLFFFLMFVLKTILGPKCGLVKDKQKGYLVLIIVSAFLFIGLFDHFFWTLQQGQLMFWLVLGLSVGLWVKVIRFSTVLSDLTSDR